MIRIFEDIISRRCRDISKYSMLTQLGSGTYGQVHKGVPKSPNRTAEPVAIKEILIADTKRLILAVREIIFLKCLNHRNVLKLFEVCYSNTTPGVEGFSVHLVLELCEYDLQELIKNAKVNFSLSNKKNIMGQLIRGLCYIHKEKVLHRDMKPANIFITKQGTLKIADFGLSRATSQSSISYTNNVVTLCYRPPELLLGARNYGPPIDMWSAGCIMAELWTRTPIMQGTSEQHQLLLISKLCGSINTGVWPGVDKLPLFKKVKLPADCIRKVKHCQSIYVKDRSALDLIDRLLVLDPKNRLGTDKVMDHEFFWQEPRQTTLKEILPPTPMKSYAPPPVQLSVPPQAMPRSSDRIQQHIGSRDPIHIQPGHLFDRTY